MRSKRPDGHCPGDFPLLDPDLGQFPGPAGRGRDRGGGEVARQQGAAARGEHPGEHADGTARLEGGAVPFGREQGQADRVLAPLIPAVLEPPRVGRRGVHAVEVARAEGHRCGSHRSSTSPGRVKWATIPAGSTGPRIRPAIDELAGEDADGVALAGRGPGRQPHLAGPVPGNAAVGPWPGPRVDRWQMPQLRPRVPGVLRGPWPVDPVRRARAYHDAPASATSAPSSARSRSA